MNYKKLFIGLIIASVIAFIIWLIWYFTTHTKTLKVQSVDKLNRIIKTTSPLGKINFQVDDGGNVFDAIIRKTAQYELLYRSNDAGATIEVVFRRENGLPPLELATVNMTTGEVIYAPAVVFINGQRDVK